MEIGEKKGDTELEFVEFEGTDAKLRVVLVRGDEVEVQLVDSVEDYIILAGGETRQEAVQGAVAALEAIVAHLQGPPPIASCMFCTKAAVGHRSFFVGGQVEQRIHVCSDHGDEEATTFIRRCQEAGLRISPSGC